MIKKQAFIKLIARIAPSPLVIGILLAIPSCATDTPEAGIKRFWQAVAEGNADKILRTQIYYRPGMTSQYLWTIKDIEWLRLDSCSTVYQSPGRAIVYYQVVFKKKGQEKTTRYSTGSALILLNGEWRMGRPVGALATPKSPP